MDIILTVVLIVCLLGAGIFNFVSTAPDKYIRVALGLVIIAVAILTIVVLGGTPLHR
jgi:hypothetical protein